VENYEMFLISFWEKGRKYDDDLGASGSHLGNEREGNFTKTPTL
jgi:hypothetical protein